MRNSPRVGQYPRGGPRSGMTLIEVLLALAILAIGLGSLMVGVTRCMGVVRQAQNYETARRLLSKVQVESELDPDSEEGVKEGEDGGEFDDAPGFHWTRVITRLGEEEDHLFEVVTRVAWADGGRPSQETLTTWIYAPQSDTP